MYELLDELENYSKSDEDISKKVLNINNLVKNFLFTHQENATIPTESESRSCLLLLEVKEKLRFK